MRARNLSLAAEAWFISGAASRAVVGRRRSFIMTYLKVPLLVALCAGSAACQNTSTKEAATADAVQARVIHNVKTTAYTHSEADHLKHGTQTAAGGSLKYGEVRSAAADWSVYPVGTKFKIEGEPFVYEVDDYGSALVGTHTIDLYKPTKASVNSWGARHVSINVLEWGSARRSLAILKPRAKKAGAVHKMVASLENTPARKLAETTP